LGGGNRLAGLTPPLISRGRGDRPKQGGARRCPYPVFGQKRKPEVPVVGRGTGDINSTFCPLRVDRFSRNTTGGGEKKFWDIFVAGGVETGERVGIYGALLCEKIAMALALKGKGLKLGLTCAAEMGGFLTKGMSPTFVVKCHEGNEPGQWGTLKTET